MRLIQVRSLQSYSLKAILAIGIGFGALCSIAPVEAASFARMERSGAPVEQAQFFPGGNPWDQGGDRGRHRGWDNGEPRGWNHGRHRGWDEGRGPQRCRVVVERRWNEWQNRWVRERVRQCW